MINFEVELSLTWIENCELSGGENISNAGAITNAGTAATFRITDAKLHFPAVTLPVEDSIKLSRLLSEGFERTVYWNKNKLILNRNGAATYDRPKYIRESLDPSYRGVKRLFVFAYDESDDNRVTVNSHQQYLLPRVQIENYNIEIDGRNFYDQPVNDLIRQYHEIRKVSTGQGDDYTTDCLLDFDFFKKNYRLIAADLSKQKGLDADPRAIEQIIFTGTLKTRATIYYILKQSKETALQFSKGTTKVL